MKALTDVLEFAGWGLAVAWFGALVAWAVCLALLSKR